MACQECCRKEKLFQYRLKGKTHPFIDDSNLQIHLPGIETPVDEQSRTRTCHIQSYYTTYFPSRSQVSSACQSELNRALSEAREAYETWKNMQRQLRHVVKKYYF